MRAVNMIRFFGKVYHNSSTKSERLVLDLAFSIVTDISAPKYFTMKLTVLASSYFVFRTINLKIFPCYLRQEQFILNGTEEEICQSWCLSMFLDKPEVSEWIAKSVVISVWITMERNHQVHEAKWKSDSENLWRKTQVQILCSSTVSNKISRSDEFHFGDSFHARWIILLTPWCTVFLAVGYFPQTPRYAQTHCFTSS